MRSRSISEEFQKKILRHLTLKNSMIVEIISIILGFIVAGAIWTIKGGSIKGFVMFILVFIVGGLGLIVGMDHLDRWRQDKQETKTIDESPEIDIEIQEGETELEALFRSYYENKDN